MFDDWLRKLAAARKGPATLHASRGREYNGTITLNADFTGATLRGEVRLYPDAPGAALASFLVTGPVVAAGTTTFTINLTPATVDGLPADSALDGFAQFTYDLLLTPSGGDEDLLFGGIFEVIGRVTE